MLRLLQWRRAMNMNEHRRQLRTGGCRSGIVLSAILLMLSGLAVQGQTEWAYTSITDNASTPLANDCRRPMSAGLYDLTANKTFVCFTGASMEPIVAAYDHGSNTWSTPVGIGIPDSSTDNHNYPHMFQSADGYGAPITPPVRSSSE